MSSNPPWWRQAKDVLYRVLIERGVGDPDVGWVDKIGDGLHYVAYTTDVELDGENVDVVVRIPKEDRGDERDDAVRREVRVREHLMDVESSVFEVAEPIGTAPAAKGPGIVDHYCPGPPLRADYVQNAVDPAEVTGRVAAAVHAVPVDVFREFVDGFETRRAHAESALSIFDELDHESFAEAGEWCGEHLPDGDPAVLLHGDLLPQNLLLDVSLDDLLEDDIEWAPVRLIDWEAVRLGDPAYDLAIVSRGHRRVFKTNERSLDDLVAAYNRWADRPVDIEHVRFWELWLKASFAHSVHRDEGMTAHTEQNIEELEAILRRAR